MLPSSGSRKRSYPSVTTPADASAEATESCEASGSTSASLQFPPLPVTDSLQLLLLRPKSAASPRPAFSGPRLQPAYDLLRPASGEPLSRPVFPKGWRGARVEAVLLLLLVTGRRATRSAHLLSDGQKRLREQSRGSTHRHRHRQQEQNGRHLVDLALCLAPADTSYAEPLWGLPMSLRRPVPSVRKCVFSHALHRE